MKSPNIRTTVGGPAAMICAQRRLTSLLKQQDPVNYCGGKWMQPREIFIWAQGNETVEIGNFPREAELEWLCFTGNMKAITDLSV